MIEVLISEDIHPSNSAIVATAHKLARFVYHLLTHPRPLYDLSATEYERRARDRGIAVLRHKAAKLGLTFVESSSHPAIFEGSEQPL
jgi:hypothetical protein